MDVKSFALGYNAGANQKGGSVSQAELEAAIKNVVPGWALEENPPEVDADPAGTAQTLVNDLARKTAQDLANYYNKSQTLTKDEINALVSAIPKFKIEVVTALPTSNIRETTVYLVKSGDDDTNLYTEYIHAGGKWEKLGTQTVDLTGYLTKEDADTLYADKQTTETALTEHREKIADLEEALANSTVEFAPSVDWLNANGDTSKKYYLPDNYEYTYRQKLVTIKHEANTKNKAGLNAIASGNTMTPNPYNGIYTIDAVEVDKSLDSCKVTISGLDQLVCVYYDALWIYFFDESGKKLADVSSYSLGNVPAESPVDLPYEVDLARIEGGWTKPVPFKASKYVMMSMGIKAGGIELSDIKNLSVNFAPLDRTENVWGWYSTGVQHSNDQATKKNSEDIAALNERTTALGEEVADLQKTVENGGMTYEPTGEVLYAIGDSITYGTGVGGNINAWPTHLMDIMGYDTENSRNLGISGIGFCTPVLERTVRDVVDERDFSVADVVTVAIGVNDWKNGSAKVADFFTELEYCLGKIRSDNPYCKIFYILPFNFLPKDSVFETFWALGYKLPGTTADYCFGNTLQEFVNLIKEKFEEEPLKSLDVHVFDMTKGPITRYNIETALIGGDDGIHPTAETHKVLAREIARRISNA